MMNDASRDGEKKRKKNLLLGVLFEESNKRIENIPTPVGVLIFSGKKTIALHTCRLRIYNWLAITHAWQKGGQLLRSYICSRNKGL